jgi:hypothetical protein
MGNRIIRRAHKDAAEKRIIRILRKRYELHRLDTRSQEVLVPMDKPVFWGYRRFLVLREDVAKRKDSGRFQALLALVQHVQDSKRKDFKTRLGRSKAWQENYHRPRRISARVFKNLPVSLKCYFIGAWNEKQMVYRVDDPWMFETRVHKLWITHRRIPNVEFKQEEAYWDDIWEQGQLSGTYRKIKSRKARWKTWILELPEHKRTRLLHEAEKKAALELHASGLLQIERGKEVSPNAEA